MDVPLEGALALYSLTAAQVFREPVGDSKAIIAWSANTIVVAFRGTASFANVLNDIKVLFCERHVGESVLYGYVAHVCEGEVCAGADLASGSTVRIGTRAHRPGRSRTRRSEACCATSPGPWSTVGSSRPGDRRASTRASSTTFAA